MFPRIDAQVKLDDLYGTVFPSTVMFLADTYIAVAKPMNALSGYSPHDRLFVFKPDELKALNLVTGTPVVPVAAPAPTLAKTRS